MMAVHKITTETPNPSSPATEEDVRPAPVAETEEVGQESVAPPTEEGEGDDRQYDGHPASDSYGDDKDDPTLTTDDVVPEAEETPVMEAPAAADQDLPPDIEEEEDEDFDFEEEEEDDDDVD